jgi:signal transduction histidine kinase/CheY-like chemotaxis protein
VATVARRGEFDARGVHEGLNLLWTFVAISAGTGLLLASIMAERTVAVAEQERVAGALRGIVEGTASPATDAVLASLVRHLASTLGVAHAVIGQLTPTGRSRPLALWSRGAPKGGVDALIGPGGADLQAALGAASYLGAPLVDSTGRTTGVIGVLDDGPLEVTPLTHDLLKVCGARAAAELERGAHEEARRRLEAQVWHTQKLESIGVLAGGVAHDFNNLLVGVLGNAARALNEVPPDSPARATLQKIETAGRRAAELTNQLLAYSGRGRFTIEPVDLSALVDEMIDLIFASVSRKAEVRRELAKELPPIEGDATQLRQVVMNLLTNASDAIGDGAGQVIVRTGVRRFTRDELARGHADRDLPEGEYVFVEVADTGCGMTDATLERIFEPFFSTKFAGRGLGLAAVLGIIRGHRGAILVDTTPGRGSTFVVALPRAELAPVTRSPRPPAPGAGQGTILVVDDEHVVRDLVRATLVESGYTVLTAVDGQDALEVFAAHGPEVRAVLLDVTMPRLGGLEVLGELRRQRPGLPVVLTSGYTLAAELGEPGRGVPFLPKPFTPAELLHAIAGVLAAA